MPFKALGVMLNIFSGQHFTHIGSPGRVADHCGASANQRDRFIARHLQALHQRQRHKMSRRQAVRRAVKPDVKRRFACIDQIPDLRFVS